MEQESLDLSLSLTARYPKMRDLLTAIVYGSRAGLHGVAADLDHSPSELSRMLNRDQDDPRKLDVEDLVGIIASTGDVRPIRWLHEKFMRDPAAKQAEAVAQLARMMPALAELLEQSGVQAAAKGRR
jgi:hypothetical protein